MKITIEPTHQLTVVGGVKVRLWEGVTDRGVRCKVFVRVIAVHNDEDQLAFDLELRELELADCNVRFGAILREKP